MSTKRRRGLGLCNRSFFDIPGDGRRLKGLASRGRRAGRAHRGGPSVREHIRAALSVSAVDRLLAAARSVKGASSKTRRQWEAAAEIRRNQLERIERLQQDQRDVAELKGEAKP